MPVRLRVRRWGHYRARLNLQPTVTRPFGAAVRAGLKDTLFPDDPFLGLGGMPPAWRVARYFVPVLDWAAGYPVASFWYELEEPRGGAGGHVVAAGGVHRWLQGEGVRRPAAVHAARLHNGLLHRRPAGCSWIPQAGDPDGFHVTAGDHRVHGRHSGRDQLQQLKGFLGMTHFNTRKSPPSSSGPSRSSPRCSPSVPRRPPATLPSAWSVTATMDGERRRRPTRRETAGGEVGPRGVGEDAEVEEEEREHREGGAAWQCGEREEKSVRERGGEREGDDVATLTRGAHVGPTLTQLPRRTKPGSKPPKDLK